MANKIYRVRMEFNVSTSSDRATALKTCREYVAKLKEDQEVEEMFVSPSDGDILNLTPRDNVFMRLTDFEVVGDEPEAPVNDEEGLEEASNG